MPQTSEWKLRAAIFLAALVALFLVFGQPGGEAAMDDRDTILHQYDYALMYYFPDESVRMEAISVMECESRFDRHAVGPRTSTGRARGLMQIMPAWVTGWYYDGVKLPVLPDIANVTDNPDMLYRPDVNIAVAAAIYRSTGDWQEWACKP